MAKISTLCLPWIVFSFSLLVTSAPLHGVTFNLLPATSDTNSIDIGLTVGTLSDTQTSEASGTIEADLGWEVEGDGVKITTVTLTGGALSFTDIDFQLIILTVQGRGLGGTVDTPDPPGVGVVTDGAFDAADHEMIINQGLFVVTGSPDTDLSERPFGGSGSGEGLISLLETGRVGNQVNYDVSFTLPIAFTDRQPTSPGGAIFIDIDVAGTLAGSGPWTVTIGQEDADFDADGDVDGQDFLIWQRGNGALGSATRAQGDADSDSNVDALDLAVWLSQFGVPAMVSSSTVASVPEPCTLALVLITGSLLVLPCKRRIKSPSQISLPRFRAEGLSRQRKVRSGGNR